MPEWIAQEGPLPETIAALRTLADDPKWEVRKEVADNLRLLPDDDLVEIAELLIDDINAFVRQAARRALQRYQQRMQDAQHRRQKLDLIGGQLAGFERCHGKRAAQWARAIAERLCDTITGAALHDLQNIIGPLEADLKALRRRTASDEIPPLELYNRLGRTVEQVTSLLRILDDMRAYTARA